MAAVCVEVGGFVGVTELTVAVVVEAGEDDGAAGTARGRCAERMFEKRAPVGKAIHVGRLDDRVAVTAGDGAVVVGDEQQDVSEASLGLGPGPRHGRCGCGTAENKLTAIDGRHVLKNLPGGKRS